MNKHFVLFVVAILSLCMYGQTGHGKLSLQEAVVIGLKNNPEVKSALENISASKGKFWSGISLPQPEIGISYEYAPVNSSLSNYTEKTLAVSQSFEFPSNYFLKGSLLSKEEKITAYKLLVTERSIQSRIKTSYYKVLLKQGQVKFAEENLATSEAFLKKSEIRQNIGEGTNLERLTAKVQLTEARNNLEVAKTELTTAFAELHYVLGFGKQPDNPGFELTDSLVFINHGINVQQIYSSVEEMNPQTKIAELRYEIASVEKNLSWSSLLPDIHLSYFKQARDGNDGFYGASFGVSVPLWFMFDQRGKIQEAAANQVISESEVQLTKNEVALKLQSAITDHENNFKQVTMYVNDVLPQAEEIYRIAIRSYDAGELTYLEYLQAKQILTSSRNSYINALFNHYQSVFRIEEIAGQNSIDISELEK